MQPLILIKFDNTTSGNQHQQIKSKGMKKTILAYGELLWDLLPSGKVLGGATTNFIFRIHVFGDNGFLISKLGNDRNGEEAREALTTLGLAVHHVQTDPKLPTGTVPVTLDAQGTPAFVITPDVAYDHIALTGDMLHLGALADCVYFGTLSQRAEQSRNTLYQLLKASPQAVKFLDLNLRKDCYTKETIMESLNAADILKINNEELSVLQSLPGLAEKSPRELTADLLEKYHLRLVLVTLAGKGAFVVTESGQYVYDPGYLVSVQDTVGSGDAFSAGFLHHYLAGSSPEEALKFGNAAGAMVAGTRGGTHLIKKDEIIRFMSAEHTRVTQ